MSDDLLELTAAQAAERVRAGEPRRAELFDSYRERAAADELGAFLWVADEAPDTAADAPLGGVPLAVKDLFCVEGVPSTSGSRILEGYRPPYTATAVAEPQARGRADARQDQHGRVRDGLVERELGLRAGAEPVGHRARAGRLERRLGGRGGGGPRAVGDRHRHRRLDPPAGVAVRDRRAQAHLRRGLAATG